MNGEMVVTEPYRQGPDDAEETGVARREHTHPCARVEPFGDSIESRRKWTTEALAGLNRSHVVEQTLITDNNIGVADCRVATGERMATYHSDNIEMPGSRPVNHGRSPDPHRSRP